MDILPALRPGSFVAIYARHAARDEITHVAAKLALRGPVTVLDGGNRFQAYHLAHLLRKETVNVTTVANRLFIRRAFTCYQMLALLENTQALRQPYLVLDLLNSFYDDQVQPHEVDRLLEACLRQIDRLRRCASVAVTLGQPLLVERAYLVEKVCSLADTVFTEEETIPQEVQLQLF